MALILDEDLEELRHRTNIADVIGGYLQLKKTGSRLRGLCCFHQEKTPSLVVDAAKGLYNCFGCGAGGDVFTFVREVEGLSFTEAAERLAGQAGMTLRYSGKVGAPSGARRRLVEANEAAALFFAEKLTGSKEATQARKHLEDRGFSREDAESWRLGFAPQGRDVLYRHLLDKKFSSKEIVGAGLASVGESGSHVDRFRGRLVFPIRDVSGDTVGFGARTLSDQGPKYLNSSETPIYRKGKLLYGLDQAKSSLVSGDTAVVCEGYTDVIALHKVGVTNAVATCGTALGEAHFQLIKRFCDRVILAFDSDAAGALASERGFEFHHSVGVEVMVASLPEGLDPADLALHEGEEAVAKTLQAARPLREFVLEAEVLRRRLDTPEARAKTVRELAPIIGSEPDQLARNEYSFWLAKRIGVDPEGVQRAVSETSRKSSQRSADAPRQGIQERLPGHVKVEREALTMLLNDVGRIRKAGVSTEHFSLVQHRVLLEALRESGEQGSITSLMDLLPDDASRRLAAELAIADSYSTPEEVVGRLEEFRLNRQIKEVRTQLDRTDESAENYDELFRGILDLEAQRRALGEG